MSKLPKFFLAVSVTAFTVAFATVGRDNMVPAWAVAMPIGAVFLGWFLIAFILQNEVTQFDSETRVRIELANRHAPTASPAAEIRSEPVPIGGAFSAATSR